VVVLGGGAVAVELASYYAGFGCRVSLVQRGPRLLGALDPEAGAALEEGLNRRGVKVFCGTILRRVERAGAGCRVVFSRGSVEHTVEADRLVEALGREPALEGLGLENAGFPAGTSRLQVGPTQQTEVPHLFAAGDVCGTADVVHVAVQQGELAARNAVAWLSGAGDLEKMDRRLALYAVFSRPEVASVGLTEREAAARGLEVDTAMHPFADHGRAMVAGEVDGFVKLIVDRRTREILGASVVGAHASELVQEMVLAIHFRARAGDVAGLPHYHPTFGEIWTYPAEALA
jgi:pyruvate/2-oxoglutarate dehydrogenase complex dihydrolipoamide dehydrogenase (E3) component